MFALILISIPSFTRLEVFQFPKKKKEEGNPQIWIDFNPIYRPSKEGLTL